MTLQYAIEIDDVEQLATEDCSSQEVIEALLQFGKQMDDEGRSELVAETTRLTEEAMDA